MADAGGVAASAEWAAGMPGPSHEPCRRTWAPPRWLGLGRSDAEFLTRVCSRRCWLYVGLGEFGAVLTHHHDGNIRVGAGDLWHGGGIDDAKTADVLDAQFGIEW